MTKTLMDGMWPDTRGYLPDAVLETLGNNVSLGESEACAPISSIETLQNCRYFGFAVPRLLGGTGASLYECAAIQRRIGQVDAGLAVGLNMHLCTVGILGYVRQLSLLNVDDILKEVATSQSIVCSAGSEIDSGGAITKSSFITRSCKGGYIVSGKKTPVSLARHGNLVHFGFTDPSSSHGQVLRAVIPMRQASVVIEKTWNSLGVRSSGSDTVVFQECYVSEDQIIAVQDTDRAHYLAGALAWYCIPLTAAYLGVVNGVFLETITRLQARNIHSAGIPRGSLTSFQCALGDIAAKALTLEVSCAKLAFHASEPNADLDAILPYALGLKYSATEICRDIVARGSELAGGATYGESNCIAKAIRDIAALALHVPGRVMSQQMLGRLMLGMPADFSYYEPASAGSQREGMTEK